MSVSLDEAIYHVNEYITRGYKSIYLMDSWMKIKEYFDQLSKTNKDKDCK